MDYNEQNNYQGRPQPRQAPPPHGQPQQSPPQQRQPHQRPPQPNFQPQPAYQPQPVYQEPEIPDEYRPIRAWGYFGYQLLFSIPLIGFIFLCVFALGGTSNINVRNYARSHFCVFALALIVGIIAAIIIGCTVGFAGFFANMEGYF